MKNFFGEEVKPEPLTFNREGEHLIVLRGGKYTAHVSSNGWNGTVVINHQVGEPLLHIPNNFILSFAEMNQIQEAWKKEFV